MNETCVMAYWHIESYASLLFRWHMLHSRRMETVLAGTASQEQHQRPPRSDTCRPILTFQLWSA